MFSLAAGVRRTLNSCCLLMLLSLSLGAQAAPPALLDSAAADPQVVLIGTGEWTPYVEQSRSDAGPTGRLISAVFARAGYRVEYFFYPWARNVLLLQKGQLDGVMPYLCNPERQAFSLCSDSMVNSQLAIFHRQDQPFDWHTLKDLEAHSIAVTNGYSYGLEFDRGRAAGRFKLRSDSREDAGMRWLLAGQVDLHLQDLSVANTLLKRSFTPEQQRQLVAHPRPVSREPLGLLLTKNARGEQLRQVFNAGLQALRESGELQRLQEALDAGQAADWQPKF
jgi:polar amino acid transport system substrate-binding protein